MHGFQRDLKEGCNKIECPVFASSAIKTGEHWTRIATIDFKMGGAFINNVDNKYVPSVLELLQSLVECDTSEKKITSWQNDGPVFDAVPSIYVKFASMCRAKLGYRVLRRMLRHAFDSRTKPLDDTSVDLIWYKGKAGIHLSCEIPASMKKQMYMG